MTADRQQELRSFAGVVARFLLSCTAVEGQVSVDAAGPLAHMQPLDDGGQQLLSQAPQLMHPLGPGVAASSSCACLNS